MPKYVKVQGTWKAVNESADCGRIKVNGVWRTVSNSYVKVSGAWKAVCAPVVTTTTVAPTTTTTSAPPPPTTTATTSGTTPLPTTTTTTTTLTPGCGIMPNVIGLTNSQASDAIVAKEIQYEFTNYTSVGATALNDNTVQAQDPAPGTFVGCGFVYQAGVTLYQFTGTTVAPTTTTTTTTTTAGPTTTQIPNCGIMPNVIGLSETAASNAIVARGIAYEFTNYTSVGATALNDNTVQAQDPAPGTNVGSCNFSYNAGLTLYAYTAPATTTTTAVPGTTPTTTTTAAPATTTTTTTTSAPANCTMPNVIGLSETAASNSIVASGWLYEFTSYSSVGATALNNNTVKSQDPAAGTTAQCGLNAGITLYDYTAPATTAATTAATTSGVTSAPNTTSGVTSAPNTTTSPPVSCDGFYRIFQGQPGYVASCDGYASLFNNCNVFLGCDD